VAIHVESATSLDTLIESAKSKGMQVYLALNPETPIDLIHNKLSKIDGVLIMTVKPGKYGSKFLPETLDKVREIRKITSEMNIEVDGGMNPANVRKAREAGANIFASGSFILKSSNPSKSIKELEKAARVPYP
jgi:ribulose-phosphate 3-epimerase